ncbi:hypothetical protein D3C85_1093480 [compost metagenome]
MRKIHGNHGLRDGQFVEGGDILRRQRQLPIDDVEGVMQGELLHQVGRAAIDELGHQVVHHRVDEFVAPGRDRLRQKGFLEDSAEARMLGRIHGRDATPEADAQVVGIGVIGEGLRIAQHLRHFVVAKDAIVGSPIGTGDVRVEPHQRPVFTRLDRSLAPQLGYPRVGIQVIAEYKRILQKGVERRILKILDALHSAYHCNSPTFQNTFTTPRHRSDYCCLPG